MAEIDVDEQIETAFQEMKEAQNALLASGFPEQQWEMIRSFIAAAIEHSQWQYVKGLQNLPPLP